MEGSLWSSPKWHGHEGGEEEDTWIDNQEGDWGIIEVLKNVVEVEFLTQGKVWWRVQECSRWTWDGLKLQQSDLVWGIYVPYG